MQADRTQAEEKQTPMSPWLYKAVLPLALGGIVLLAGLAYWRDRGTPGRTPGDAARAGGVRAGMAPAFQAKTLTGREVSFPKDYRGKLVLLDFWATWCPPCLVEFPHVRSAYERFKDQGFEVVGVSLDAPNGISAETVRGFLNQNNAPWENIYEGVIRLASAYRVVGIPATFLVDGDTGVVLAQGERFVVRPCRRRSRAR